MSNMTYDEKTNFIIKKFLIYTPLFILLGLLLLNDYSLEAKFDPSKVYNVIKDGLTLSAAFLAPAVALVLFSSWKEQYFQTKIEKDAQSIYEDVVGYLSLLHKLERIVQKNKIDENEYQKAIELRDRLRPVSEELNRKIIGFKAQSEYESESGLLFHAKSKDISIYFRNATSGIRNLIGGFEKDLVSGNYLQRTPHYDIVLGDDVYDNLDELSEGLSALAAYKSQVVSVIN